MGLNDLRISDERLLIVLCTIILSRLYPTVDFDEEDYYIYRNIEGGGNSYED